MSRNEGSTPACGTRMWGIRRLEADGGGCLEFGEDCGGEDLLGGFVLGLGEAEAVDGDEQELLAFEDVEGGGVARAGDEEGVAAEAGNGDEAAGGAHGVAEGFVFDAGLMEREVDAGFALAVGPGAVGGAVGGGAGFAVEEGRVRFTVEDGSLQATTLKLSICLNV